MQKNIGAISESIGDYGGKTVLATPIELMLANSVDPPKAPDAGDGTAASPRAPPRSGGCAARARSRSPRR